MSEPDRTSNSPPRLRTSTGIKGLDEITGGGIPTGRTTILTGESGTGKTVFSLQVLSHSARQLNAPGIFVGFEEKSREIISNAIDFGWDLADLEKQGKIFFLDGRFSADIIQTGKFDLIGMLAGLKAKADAMGAKLIVFDSIDLLLSLLDDPFAERRECYRLKDWLAENNFTCLISMRMSANEASSAIYPSSDLVRLMEFMADCLIMLRRDLDNHLSLRALRVLKFRGGHFDENELPMIINSGGIEVATYGRDLPEPVPTFERITSGIDSLDQLLNGGYFRGASVLISGAPGTAKSTLAGAFAEAACLRKERTLYISFDQKASALVHSLTSVNIHLQPYIESGVLTMYATRASMLRVEEHVMKLQALIERHQVHCLVIDPMSATFRMGGQLAGKTVAEQLLHYTWLHGITTICTTSSRENEQLPNESWEQVASIIDTWIHLDYQVQDGFYGRSLIIIKSRGTKHANRTQKMTLEDSGVTLKE